MTHVIESFPLQCKQLYRVRKEKTRPLWNQNNCPHKLNRKPSHHHTPPLEWCKSMTTTTMACDDRETMICSDLPSILEVKWWSWAHRGRNLWRATGIIIHPQRCWFRNTCLTHTRPIAFPDLPCHHLFDIPWKDGRAAANWKTFFLGYDPIPGVWPIQSTYSIRAFLPSPHCLFLPRQSHLATASSLSNSQGGLINSLKRLNAHTIPRAT